MLNFQHLKNTVSVTSDCFKPLCTDFSKRWSLLHQFTCLLMYTNETETDLKTRHKHLTFLTQDEHRLKHPVGSLVNSVFLEEIRQF